MRHISYRVFRVSCLLVDMNTLYHTLHRDFDYLIPVLRERFEEQLGYLLVGD